MAKQTVQSINWTTIAVVLIVIIGFLAAIMYLVPNQSSQKTVSVTGNADISVPPDNVVVDVQVQTASPNSADEAKNMNANVSNAVLTALTNIGVNSSSIQTEGFSISPEYNYTPDNGQVLEGYIATNSMIVTLTDLNRTGKVVDASVDAGGLIDYINYDLSTAKQNQYKATALSAASEDAKTKAEAIASGLGESLGNLVSVSSSEYNYVPYPIYNMVAGSAPSVAKQAATNLPTQNIDVTGTVSVVYQIG